MLTPHRGYRISGMRGLIRQQVVNVRQTMSVRLRRRAHTLASSGSDADAQQRQHQSGRVSALDIAVIGSGISGLACAHYLSEEHRVHVFEANRQIGGHTATVDVELGTRR
ncbi:MAG: FAD-dependent oxidoreductase, partial [Chromatocurvus sp.]